MGFLPPPFAHNQLGTIFNMGLAALFSKTFVLRDSKEGSSLVNVSCKVVVAHLNAAYIIQKAAFKTNSGSLLCKLGSLGVSVGFPICNFQRPPVFVSMGAYHVAGVNYTCTSACLFCSFLPCTACSLLSLSTLTAR